MPISIDCPEPYRSALTQMESTVQSSKSSLAYAAPEVQDFHWAKLQERLAGIIVEAIDAAKDSDGD